MKKYISIPLGLAVAVVAVVFASYATAHADTATTTASTTPVISSIVAANGSDGTSETISWMTDQPASSQVWYGTMSGIYPNFSPVDTTSTSTHSITLTGLMSGTLYHFLVTSGNSSGMTGQSLDQMFTTSGTSTTSTSTNRLSTTTVMGTTDIPTLQNWVLQLLNQVSSLEQQITILTNNQGTTTTGNGTGSTSNGMMSVTPNNSSVRAGTTVDFTGRGFGIEEPVMVTSNGSTVTTAHADNAGNFSTGSLPVSWTQGSQTYTFTGARSGITGSATITITQ